MAARSLSVPLHVDVWALVCWRNMWKLWKLGKSYEIVLNCMSLYEIVLSCIVILILYLAMQCNAIGFWGFRLCWSPNTIPVHRAEGLEPFYHGYVRWAFFFFCKSLSGKSCPSQIAILSNLHLLINKIDWMLRHVETSLSLSLIYIYIQYPQKMTWWGFGGILYTRWYKDFKLRHSICKAQCAQSLHLIENWASQLSWTQEFSHHCSLYKRGLLHKTISTQSVGDPLRAVLRKVQCHFASNHQKSSNARCSWTNTRS